MCHWILRSRKMAPTDIHHLLNIYKKKTVDVSTVRQWVISFKRQQWCMWQAMKCKVFQSIHLCVMIRDLCLELNIEISQSSYQMNPIGTHQKIERSMNANLLGFQNHILLQMMRCGVNTTSWNQNYSPWIATCEFLINCSLLMKIGKMLLCS